LRKAAAGRGLGLRWGRRFEVFSVFFVFSCISP
jgi:hypothetical protein